MLSAWGQTSFCHSQFTVHRGFLGLCFVLVQGEYFLLIVIAGKLCVVDNRPLGRFVVGNLNAPAVNLDLGGVNLIGCGRPLVYGVALRKNNVRKI